MTHIDELSHVSDNDGENLRVMHAELSDQSDSIPSLDLHGFTKDDAEAAIKDFISHQIFIKESCCRIVHGKGMGVIESVVKREVKQLMHDKVIESSFPSQHYLGAAIVVVLPETN
jgi:DNA-nicking Smr family endonuclease